MHGPQCVFVAEFKMGTSEEAMAQVRAHGYLDPYRGGTKRVSAVGVGSARKSATSRLGKSRR